MTGQGCPLCSGEGGRVLWRDAALRVVAVDDPDHPGTLRVIWNAHVREMGDLDPAQHEKLLAAVFAAEAALREALAPEKINLASLGNVVPHLHWHVIARFGDDPHFPNAVWGARLREADPGRTAERRAAMEGLAPLLVRRLAAG